MEAATAIGGGESVGSGLTGLYVGKGETCVGLVAEGLAVTIPLVANGLGAAEAGINLKALVHAEVTCGLGGGHLAEAFFNDQVHRRAGDTVAGIADGTGIRASIFSCGIAESESCRCGVGKEDTITTPLVVEVGSRSCHGEGGSFIGADGLSYRLLGEAEFRSERNLEVAAGTTTTGSLRSDTDGATRTGELDGDAIGSCTTGNGCASGQGPVITAGTTNGWNAVGTAGVFAACGIAYNRGGVVN